MAAHAELLSRAAGADGRSPHELFGEVSDDDWFWLNTAGYRASSDIRALLPGLPEEGVQLRWTNRAGDETLAEGFRVYQLMRSLYEQHGGPLAEASGILDFGCGFGRMVRFFLRDVDPSRLAGSDYNESLIEFCRESFRWGEFMRNDAGPPLTADDDSVQFIYAYSVFSHFSEPLHLTWLREFKRVLRPGGILALTVRPRHFIEYCARVRATGEDLGGDQSILAGMFPDADEELAHYDAGGFCYSPYDSSTADAWWGEACIPRAYVEREWGKLFELCGWVDADADLKQHVAVLRA